MRIALITDELWPYTVGGMQRHSYFLCKYFAGAGTNVDVYYTTRDGMQRQPEENFSGAELSRLAFFYVPYPKGPYFPGHYLYKSYRYSSVVYQEISKRIDEYDISYIQGFSGWKLLSQRFSSDKEHPPSILNFHGLEMFQGAASFKKSIEQFVFRHFARKLLLRADYVQSLGGRLTPLLLSLAVKKEKIIEWGIAIEREWLANRISDGSAIRTFVFIGRYERRKGVQELNSVLKRLISENHPFKMNFIGPIPAGFQIQDQKIQYHGLLKNDKDIRQVLDKSDYIVVPSYAEGMPTVILEAMARGLAVIASDCGAVNELVSSENGYLVQPGDINGLYERMKEAIFINEEALRLKKNASLKKVAAGYLWEGLSNKMLDGFVNISKKSRREV